MITFVSKNGDAVGFPVSLILNLNEVQFGGLLFTHTFYILVDCKSESQSAQLSKSNHRRNVEQDIFAVGVMINQPLA